MFDETLRELIIPVTREGKLICEQVDGLFRVKEVGRYYLDVCPMALNYRLCTTLIDLPGIYDRHWCYVGRGRPAWMAAVLAAAMWDGSDDTEPLGWNKNGTTGKWREPGMHDTWQASRAVQVLADRLVQDV